MKNFFGKGKERIRGKLWDWENFKTTKDFPVSEELLDWVIGQDRALKECYLCLDEWVQKLKWIEKEKWFKIWEDPNSEKPLIRKLIPPGPYLLLLGDPGTGKSLIGRALASHLTHLYKKHGIKLRDVLCWPNKLIPSEPRISVHEAGKGKKIVRIEKLKCEKRQKVKRYFAKFLTYFMSAVGLAFISAGFYFLWLAYLNWFANPITWQGPLQEVWSHNFLAYFVSKFIEIGSITFLPAGIMLIFLFLILVLNRYGFIGGAKGISGSEQTEAPKLIVDNSEKLAPFIDATGHGSAQLFGCLDEKTRLFTTDGLKHWSEIKKGDLVFTLNKEQEIEIQPVEEVFIYNYSGEMLSLSSKKGLDFCVTPNHKILYRPRNFYYDKFRSPLKYGEIGEAMSKSRFYIPQSGLWNSKTDNIKNDDLLRLIGWYLSEGRYVPNRNYVAISQEKHADLVKKLLDRMKINYYVNKDEFFITDKDIVALLKEFGRYSHERFIPRKYLSNSRKKLQVLFETLMLGDGNKNRTTYYTTSKRLRDNMIELGMKLGYSVTISKDARNPERWKTGYIINFAHKAGYVKTSKIRKVKYSGKVWCIQTKNHNFLIERNGKFSFTGNSIAWDPLQTGGLGCYSMDTSVVTTDGIKSYWQLKEGDKVLSFNPKNGRIEEKEILSVYLYPYSGPMYHYCTKQLDLMVTPNHKVFFKTCRSDWQVREVKDIYYYQFKIPVKGEWTGSITTDLRELIPGSIFKKHNTNILPRLELGDFLELIGWFIGDGHLIHRRKYVAITQSKRTRNLLALLDKMKLKYTIDHYKKQIIIPYNQLYEFCKRYCLTGKGRSKKRFPPFVLDYPKELLKRLFDGLVQNDGCQNKAGRFYRFSTSIPEIRDSFILLVAKLGLHCTFKTRTRKPRFIESLGRIIKQNKPNYEVLIQENAKGYVDKRNLEIIRNNPDRFVWCPVVKDLHNLLVVRNGKMCYSGNTPEHQRTTAGDVHRANLGILYIDEIKNLKPEEAITLLTVLEEGQLPITLRSRWHAGGTAAMAVSTEPVPCLCFLVGAGNFDSINQIHPALMDRITGYGKVVRMNNDMPNTVENRRKYVQFIAQEVKRFHLLPFSREACIEICNEGRRRSNKRDALTTKFRPLIGIIKTASTLAMNEGSKIVERKHVKEAIEKHCKTIQKQILEHQVQEKGKILEIDPKGVKLGTIYGLAVVSDPVSGERTGSVLRVKASMVKKGKRRSGYFKVSGVAKQGKFIRDSIDKVRSVILKKYNVDIAQDYCTHIDFSQAYGIDGPSAGSTMCILICSLLEGKPIRQDIAVTGEINVSTTDEIEITAVGGLHEKIKAAERWGFKKVIIPKKNFDYSIEPNDYKIEVIPGKTLDDYLDEILVRRDWNNGKEKKET